MGTFNLDRPVLIPQTFTNQSGLIGSNGGKTGSPTGSTSDRVRVDGKGFARGTERLRVCGVTFGPFAPNEVGEPLPVPSRVRADFEQMRALGVNAVRTYHLPPTWFMEEAERGGICIFVDVPWSKHLCFLDSREAQREARDNVRRAAERARDYSSVFALSIANEIPSDVVRWHGAPRVERFLGELANVARQSAPQTLVTYANYPSTEYLELPFLDFVTFNVYLEDATAFRRYLRRLQNLVCERPLLLGELGLDTLRHGEDEQSRILGGHLRDATLMGLAGSFVFAWTDEWHTGGHLIQDWAFGITRADRTPKIAALDVGEVYRSSPCDLLAQTPRVSVVVCSYNGAATLEQCLDSLLHLEYPDYEIILVDDGSTDHTRQIAAKFPQVRTIHQENCGLSAARNAGLWAATGSIVAYTDSDCFADPHWLSHLVEGLLDSGAAGVGGPNLSPDDGAVASCVAVSPGQPTHVLESDSLAEHIPGCNMAFEREALLRINGFHPQYRKAGDDVDACWRLQEAGMWLTFAPGAFVWHHRRQTPRAYLKQQVGYGEAEALLWFDHPDRFNLWGESKWRGALYGGFLDGLRLGRPVIHHGVWGTGLFQTIYRPGVSHWASIPSSLEWQLVAAMMALVGVFSAPYLSLCGVMLTASLLVAAAQAAQAPIPTAYDGAGSRLLVAALCYMQPLVRSWSRYRTRLIPNGTLQPESEQGAGATTVVPRRWAPWKFTALYWDEAGHDRTELLEHTSRHLAARHWALHKDSGWNPWDLEIYGHPWTSLQLATVQEEHGGGKRLLRVRFQMRPSSYLGIFTGLGTLLTLLMAAIHPATSLMMGIILIAFGIGVWNRGKHLAANVETTVDTVAAQMGLLRCSDAPV
jgi:GT2 family glycosyltransferase